MAVSAYMLLRWLSCPVLFVAFVWAFTLKPAPFLLQTPDIFLGAWQSNVTLDSALPPLPKLMSEAYKLGSIHTLASAASSSGNRTALTALLQEAAAVLHRDQPLTLTQLQGLLPAIELVENHKGVAARVLGVFSLVNIIWFLSIVGLVVTFSPCMAFIAKPVVELVRKLWSGLILPLLRQLKPLYEPAVYAIAFLFIVQGARYPAETGLFVALTGCVAAVPCFLYSTALHTQPTGNKDGFMQVVNIYLALVWGPQAVIYQSELLGFFTVGAVYGALGFSVACYGLCWVIGFDSKNTLYRVVANSVVLMIVFTLFRVGVLAIILQADPHYFLSPFATAVLTLGSVTYFLGLLIVSAPHVVSAAEDYWRIQIMMVLSLLLIVSVGAVYHIAPLYNTACVFGVLYAMAKVAEQRIWRGGMVFVGLFGFFACLYVIALYLRTHPGFIVAMFDGSFLVA